MRTGTEMPIFLTITVIVLGAVIGWVLNLIKLVSFYGGEFSGNEVEIILRAVGIFLAPLGAIGGWF